MSTENREQQVDQLLRGIYRMCVNRDDCKDCPFHITKCTFGEPRPSTWFDEETIVNKFSPNYLKFTDRDIVMQPKEEPATVVKEESASAPASAPEPISEPAPEPEVLPTPTRPGPATWPVSQTDSQPATAPAPQPVLQSVANDDAEGTWLVSTSMGSVFSKYVFICSKCGYRKESMFSFTPMTNCPECEKRKAGIV